MQRRQLYPIGIQTFEKIRKENYFYADKTEYVYRMTHSGTNYIFLSRPRRFGKSLLVSTLKSYFEGRKDLFKGLVIDSLETEWTQHPVLHFSMASGKHMGCEQLERYLLFQLEREEEQYGITATSPDPNVRLSNLIRRAYEKTGQQVVVLIDEYDAPLLDVVHEDENLPVLRQVMRNFYSPLKDCDPYLRFVFLTGITKFSQLSIFSELNNIKNISMEPAFAAICGITKEEMLTQMTEGIARLAEGEEMTYDEAVGALTKMYDGYHFAWPSPDIFNPFSLLNAFADGRLNAYWFGSGTPTYLLEMMKKFHVRPSQLGKAKASAEEFDAPTHTMTTIIPLLYQSGYMTIKDYNRRLRRYTLDIPNKEVRTGLMHSLVPHYVTRDTLAANNLITDIAERLFEDDMDGALRLLQTFLSTIPYVNGVKTEGHWQQVLFILFSLTNNYVDVEVHTATGRVDLVMATDTRLYLIETKLDQSAEAAMQQIDLKEYDKRFALYTLPVTKVGINFDNESHTLTDWTIENQ